jgi:hypothetical protein
VLAQVRTAGKGHELAGAQAVLAEAPLAGRVVTADALLTQREISRRIVAGGGDYLLPVKDNQPALLGDLREVFSPLGARPEAEGGRLGRAALAGARPGEPRRTPGGGGRARAEGPPRAARGAAAVGTVRPAGE